MNSAYGVRRAAHGKKMPLKNSLHTSDRIGSGEKAQPLSLPSAVRPQPDAETVLITGASGLLGRALVDEFAAAGFRVLAQHRRRPGREREAVSWLAGDFSGAAGTQAFLKRHARLLMECRRVVHAYGPVCEKATAALTSSDLLAAFQAQLGPALDITRFLLARAPLRSALFIAFEDTGRRRAYARVLAYALAKNALPLLALSLAAAHPGVAFNVFSPPTLAGASLRHPSVAPVDAGQVAARVRKLALLRSSGRHFRWPGLAARRAASRYEWKKGKN